MSHDVGAEAASGSPASRNPLKIGMVGAGNISRQYVDTIVRCDDLRLTAVSDLDLGRAASVADPLDAWSGDVESLMHRDDVDVVLNLTVPQAHAEVSLAAISAGKGVYVEKPFAATLEEGRAMLHAARSAGVVIGSAPDTVLGTGVQTARAALDSGKIGTPTSATATMVRRGHETWHPNPDFYYLPGGGPLLDMGPYDVASLVTLLGPVERVIGAGSAPQDYRVIGSGPRAGERIPVSTPSHVTGVLVHSSGVLSTLVMSFDGVDTQAAHLEIQGTEGSMAMPDPNHFQGPVQVSSGGGQWSTLPVLAGYSEAARGYGLTDLFWSGAFAGDPQAGRAQGELGLHVLDIMDGVLRAIDTGSAVSIESTCERPQAVPLSNR